MVLALADAKAGRIPASEVPARKSRLQQRLWDLHAAVIKAGLARNEELLAKLPFAERRFSRAWGYSPPPKPGSRSGWSRRPSVTASITLGVVGDHGIVIIVSFDGIDSPELFIAITVYTYVLPATSGAS